MRQVKEQGRSQNWRDSAARTAGTEKEPQVLPEGNPDQASTACLT